MPKFIEVNNATEIEAIRNLHLTLCDETRPFHLKKEEWVPATKFNSKDRIVNKEGREVISSYEGRQYRIIAKLERRRSNLEWAVTGLGVVTVICTLGLALFSKSVRNLCINSNEKLRFGVRHCPQHSFLERSSLAERDDFKTVSRALRQGPLALRYASPRLRNNLQIVREAVDADGLMLQYASDTIKNDFLTVYKAIRQNPAALQYASADLREKLLDHAKAFAEQYQRLSLGI